MPIVGDEQTMIVNPYTSQSDDESCQEQRRGDPNDETHPLDDEGLGAPELQDREEAAGAAPDDWKDELHEGRNTR